MKKIFFAFIAMLVLSGCSTTQVSQEEIKPLKTHQAVLKNEKKVKKQIEQNFNKWKGTKYVYGGDSKRGIDCSAFVKRMYSETFGINTTRTTLTLRKEGYKINKEDLKPGDMVFFRKNKHVGIYIGNGEFVHSSSKRGVIKSTLKEGYYKKAFTQARRLKEFV